MRPLIAAEAENCLSLVWHWSCVEQVGVGGWWAHKILVIPSQNLDFPTLDFTFETYDLDLNF